MINIIMSKEIWKTIDICKDFQISSHGRVRYKKSKEIKTPSENKMGYRIYLKRPVGVKFVHRLVADAFIPNPDNCRYIKHLDGNKRNNKVENLKWTSMSAQVKVKKVDHKSDEIWKKVKDYPEYEISNYGNLRNSNSKECYAFKKKKFGYTKQFYNKSDKSKGKGIMIHQLVAISFIPNPNNYFYVGHKDGDVCNNQVDNLYWKSAGEVNKKRITKEKLDTLDGEMWKNIDGFPYKVSNKGRVANAETNKILSNIKSDYHCVNLYKNRKMFVKRVHRLVAKAFIPNPDDKKLVNHKDGNKHNNSVNNLEWCSNSYNIQHAHDNGLIKVSSHSIIIEQYDEKDNKIREWKSASKAIKDTQISREKLYKLCETGDTYNKFTYKMIRPKENKKIIKNEIWKKIPNYDYYASSHGRIKNDKDKLLRQNGTTYKTVELRKNKKGKKFCVHKLIALSFLPNPNNYDIVNHIDHDKFNNKLSNLEWCNLSQNTQAAIKAGKIKTYKIDQYSLEKKFIKTWTSASEAGKKLNISRVGIWHALKNTNTEYGGFKWKYHNKD